jgi:hypothetical protein
LLFERAKQDPKIAAAAAKTDAFEDDANGNLVRILSQPFPVVGSTTKAHHDKHLK